MCIDNKTSATAVHKNGWLFETSKLKNVKAADLFNVSSTVVSANKYDSSISKICLHTFKQNYEALMLDCYPAGK